MAEFDDLDVPRRPARVKDIAELDKSLSVSVNTWAVGEKLKAEIRRQTVFLLTALALQGDRRGQAEPMVELIKDYERACADEDRETRPWMK